MSQDCSKLFAFRIQHAKKKEEEEQTQQKGQL